jgi:hypothetical protein
MNIFLSRIKAQAMSDSDDSSILEDPKLRPAKAGGQKWSSGKFIEVVRLGDSSDDDVILVEPEPPSPARTAACNLEVVSLADGNEADFTCAGPAAAVTAPSAPLRVCDVFKSQSIRDELHHNGGPTLIPQANSNPDLDPPWENPLEVNPVSSGEESDPDFVFKTQQQQKAEKKRKEEAAQKEPEKRGKRSKYDHLD